MKFMTQEQFDKLPEDKQKALMAQMEAIEKGQKIDKAEDDKLPQMDMKTFEGLVQTQLQKAIKSMTPVDKKHFAFPGIGTDKDLLDDLTPEGKMKKCLTWIRAFGTGDMETVRDISDDYAKKANLNEGTGSEGGYLVPEEFASEISRLRPLYGVIRRNARIMPMSRDVMNIPGAGSQDVTVSWVNEGSQIKSTDPNFRQITLVINKLAAITKVTPELLADANVDVMGYLSQIIAEKMAEEEDEQGFNGTGSPFVGLLVGTGVPTTPHAGGTAAQSLSYTDLVTATGNLYSNVLARSKFYFNRTMVAHINGLITTTGAPIFDVNSKTLLGFPLEWAEKLPTKVASVGASTPYAVFGDISQALILGERGGLRMKISEEGTVNGDNLFEKDMMGLRIIERVTFGELEASAITRIVTAV